MNSKPYLISFLLLLILAISSIYPRNLYAGSTWGEIVSDPRWKKLTSEQRVKLAASWGKDQCSDHIFRNMNDRSNRVSYANLMLKQIHSLDRKIPEPSPSEMDWVEKEQKAFKSGNSSMDRMKHVADSVELQNITLKSSLIEIISLLQSIISNETNIEYEMILWSLLSTELIESEKFDRAIKTLMDKDRLVIADYEDLRSVGFWSRESPWDIHYSTGKDILKCIITPNLMVKMGEAMDKKK